MTTDDLDSMAINRLMTWLSPSFPVGAFAYSHGLEYGVELGRVKDKDSLQEFVGGILAFGAGRIDAMLFRQAWTATREGDEEALGRIVDRADALRGTKEMALESTAQGKAFLDTVLKVWPHPRLDAWSEELDRAERQPAYAVVVAVVAALYDIPLRSALGAFLHAFAANLVSAVVRLVPLGQTDGQRALAGLEPTIIAAVNAALVREPDDLGSAAVNMDWLSIQHETQYTRLFRS